MLYYDWNNNNDLHVMESTFAEESLAIFDFSLNELSAITTHFNTVRKYHIKDLVFKYLFSVSPSSNIDNIDGLCVIYGKCSEKDQLVSAYDKQLDGQPIKPFADILPLLDGISQNEQYDKLRLLLGKYLLN